MNKTGTLSRHDSIQRKSLSEIEYSAFVVALDSKAPVSDDELSRNTLCGDANNRWFDKLLQILVFANGRASAQVEHTPLDASPGKLPQLHKHNAT